MAHLTGAALADALECVLSDRILKILRTSDVVVPFGDPTVDAEYLEYMEGIFLLKNQLHTLKKSLHPTLLFSSEAAGEKTEKKGAIVKDLLRMGSAALEHLERTLAARLQATSPLPRVLRLADKIGLQRKEEVLAFLFVLLINGGLELPTVSGLRPTCAFLARFAGMDHRTYLHFLSEERVHFKQGLIGMSDARFKMTLGECTLKMPREVLAALSSAPMTEAELLKLDKSALAEVLAGEAAAAGPSAERGGPEEGVDSLPEMDDQSEASGSQKSGRDTFDLYSYIKSETAAQSTDAPAVPQTATCEEVEAMPGRKRRRTAESDGPTANPYHPFGDSTNLSPLRVTPPLPPLENGAAGAVAEGPRDGVAPYATDLEYLGDVFKLLSLLIKIRNAEADIKDDDPEFLVQPKTEAEALLRELRGKERVQKACLDRRLARTQEAGRFMPRVELLAQHRGLTAFEKLVLLFLVGGVISHDMLIAMNSKYVMRGEEKRERTVGYLLYILCETLPQRVANRSRFYKSATLVKTGMVLVSDKPAFGDLMDCPVDLDRRMLDYLVGLDTEFNEIVEGSHLYAPRVRLEQVILPPDQKALVMATVANFDAFSAAKRKYGMEDVISYGGGLVLLFHGASGTGKTMLANAIASEVKKKLLLVNLSALLTGGKGGTGDLLKLIFREAQLYDALIFFDECEGFFESRTKNPLVTAMLAELERYTGLIVLATNKPSVMDEAMQRRITLAIEFKNPDHMMRRDIWAKHLPSGVPVSSDVDYDALALDYELSGGLIKNAVLSALSMAVSRRGSDPVISMDDLRTGAKLQLRGFFREEALAQKVIPKRSLVDCVFHDATLTALQQIVSLERGRKLLYTQWGFEEDECTKQSIVALFAGPSGTGKSLAAEVIGYETGSTLKVVNMAEVSCRPGGAATLGVEKMFEDAKKQNSILVLDEAEVLFQSSGSQGDDLAQLIAYHMAQFPRIVLLLVRTESYLTTLTSPFELKFRVHFPMPTAPHRARLWRLALPPQVPLDPSIDFARLAEQELSGAQIKAAAFFACAKASTVAAVRDGGQRVGEAWLAEAVREVQRCSRHRLAHSMFI
eukprot:EG_transcript_1254